ncbi:MAG TPA: prepilin-type N-terminal cleavage/methylation domain-containing protein [Elusimicrobiota bacterium]|jgi:prepilin-type N-terminal cleavage/methylation domain-containing protein|nr:prepilin-type N-terminal cleavage/methylation domain-containing protein [Elusimicrobiota bacterium]
MRTSARGYTLAELAVTVAILGILASVGPTLLTKTQDFFLLSTARTEIERDARASLEVMNRLLRQAVASSVTIDTPANQGPNSRVQFTHMDGRNISFYQSGTNLMQKVGSNTTTISKNLAYIAFSYPRTDDTSIISVSITMSKNIQLGRRKVLELTVQKVRIMN